MKLSELIRQLQIIKENIVEDCDAYIHINDNAHVSFEEINTIKTETICVKYSPYYEKVITINN